MNIKKFAELAGVSPATVSRVFSRNPGVSEELAQRILKTAAEYNYHPRISEKQKNVVLITPYNSIYPVQSCIDMLLMALTQELPKHGFRVEILPVNSLDRLADVRFCGAVAVGLDPGMFQDWEQKYDAPLVVLDRTPQGKSAGNNIYYVNSDESMGMELAIAYFQERKCRRIGCIIHGDPGEGNVDIRHKAILTLLKKYGFPADESLIRFSGNGNEKYVELVGKLLRLGVDALFCPGGNAGIVVLYALSLYGKQIPEDVSLIASEQTYFSNYAVPPQTTVTQEYSSVAEKTVEVILNRIAGKDVPRITTLPYRLIKRESVQ
ncbi:MAG: LacI family DNA-binding transcriptional regulator [Lentisphaeria bacterium]|nr:LacI family DNA-binding transcriptional regulator [Lentisphaeria bacterium]